MRHYTRGCLVLSVCLPAVCLPVCLSVSICLSIRLPHFTPHTHTTHTKHHTQHCIRYGAYPSQKMLSLTDTEDKFFVKGRCKDQFDTLSKYRVLLAPLRSVCCLCCSASFLFGFVCPPLSCDRLPHVCLFVGLFLCLCLYLSLSLSVSLPLSLCCLLSLSQLLSLSPTHTHTHTRTHRFGAGIKGKIADGWSVGTPSVTTPVGAEGMHSSNARKTSVCLCWCSVCVSVVPVVSSVCISVVSIHCLRPLCLLFLLYLWCLHVFVNARLSASVCLSAPCA